MAYLVATVVVLVVALTLTRALKGKSLQAPASVPQNLPLAVKAHLLTRSEQHLFEALEAAVFDQPLRVFPNLRLSDLFSITDRSQYQAIYARLRDKHVDFLLVKMPEYVPVLAIELDGKSHENEKQRYRDAVKDVAFKSAGLPLIRLDARHQHSIQTVQKLLTPYLVPTRVKARR